MLQDLPGAVVELIGSGSFAEYATISAAGVPIDTPVLYFPSEGMRTLDLATGLSYPVKAERARRNPRVGLLIEGGPSDPVISIGGIAAVRDADLQANTDRYLSEAGHWLPGDPDWSLAREAVWYWTRIIVEVTPASVLWWDSPAHTHSPPHRWSAADAAYPGSDPAPPGPPSAAPDWHAPPWPQLATRALSRGGPGHLTLIDAEGFPRPLRARSVAATRDGFALEVPDAAPWPAAGKACLTFGGIETFVGEATRHEGGVSLHVDRALPVFPMTRDMTEIWRPAPETREALMRRLRQEARRRRQQIPLIPVNRPPATEGHKRRMARRYR